METVDANLANAIDGLNGGAYALAHDLTIGGAPGTKIEFAIPLELDDNLVVHGGTFMYGDLLAMGDVYLGSGGIVRVSGPATFVQTATFQNQVEFDDYAHFLNNAEVEGLTYLNGNVQVGGIATFIDDVIVGGTLIVANPATFNSDAEFNYPVIFQDIVDFNGPAFFNVPVGFTGRGKILHRTKTISVSGNQSVVAANYDSVYIPAGVMVSPSTITIDDTGAEDGMRIEFVNDDTTVAAVAQIPGFGLAVPMTNASGFYRDCAFQRVAGTWRWMRGAKR
jgi:hypothetical protein